MSQQDTDPVEERLEIIADGHTLTDVLWWHRGDFQAVGPRAVLLALRQDEKLALRCQGEDDELVLASDAPPSGEARYVVLTHAEDYVSGEYRSATELDVEVRQRDLQLCLREDTAVDEWLERGDLE